MYHGIRAVSGCVYVNCFVLDCIIPMKRSTTRRNVVREDRGGPEGHAFAGCGDDRARKALVRS